MDHYPSIYISYAAALACWVVVWRLVPSLWPNERAYSFDHPWREAGYALIAGVGVVLIGQLYTHGIKLPTDNILGPVLEAINQITIFSPMLILLALRRQPLRTAWVRTDKLGWRLLTGIGLALIALFVYSLVREGADPWWRIVGRVYAYSEVDLAAQVFLEDVTIAILVVRIGAAMGAPATVALVAILFAAGHIPAMISNGASLSELTSLFADAALGAAVISVAMRSCDIWWFWCVHFAMDMSQFERISGVAS